MPASRLVGEAYVLMRADGRLLKRDMKKAGGEAGEAGGAEWRKAFDQEVEQSAKTMQTRFRKSLADSFVGGDFSQFRKEFGSIENTVDGLRAKLRDLTFGPDGKALPIKDRQLLKKTYDDIVVSLEAWGDAELKAQRQRENDKSIVEQAKAFATYGKNIQYASTRQERALAEQNKAWETYGKNVQHTLGSNQRAIEDQNKAWLTYGTNVQHTLSANTRAIEDQNKAWVTYGRNLNASLKLDSIRDQEEAWKSYGKAIDDGTDKVERHSSRGVRSMRALREQMDKITDRSDKFGDLIGRSFGKGSRNNFLNFVGSMVGGLSRLSIGIITFPAKAVAHIGDSFGTAFSASKAAGAGNLLSIGRGLLSIFGGKGGLIGLIAGAGLAVFGLGKVLPGVVSLMTMLAGAATALVGSIGIGLTGALLAMTPAAIGAAAGLGTVFGVINAFANDKDNTKFWEGVFETPFKEFSKQFYPKIRTFLTSIKSGFARLFEEMTPGVNKFFDTFQSKFGDESTQLALDKWANSLSRIAVFLNSAVTSAASGLVGFFAPVLPYAEKLAEYLDRVAHQFDRWANSTEGQNAIADFMKGAWENAKLVKDILVEIGSIIGTVFSSGDTTGQSFLTGIRDKLREIDDFLKTPEGRSKLDNFFGDVKEIGEGFGQLVVDVGTIVKNFNDPNARESAKNLMESLTKIGDAAVKVSEMADALGRIIGYLENPALQFLEDVFNAVSGNPGRPPAPVAPPKPVIPLEGGVGPILPGKTVTSGQPATTVDIGISVGGFTGNGAANKAIEALGLSARDIKRLAAYEVPIDMKTETYEATKAIIEAFRFTGKQVPVDGNEAAWNEVKGTVAGYAFKQKVVKIVPYGDEVYDWVAKWNRFAIKNKTARINVGVTANGGKDLTGGLTMASGGILYGPTYTQPGVLAGEAGREAYVPLDRPLSQIDKSVRWLAAIAQGKAAPTSMASGGITGGGSSPVMVTFEAGAVTTAAQDPRIVASYVKDDLVLALSH